MSDFSYLNANPYTPDHFDKWLQRDIELRIEHANLCDSIQLAYIDFDNNQIALCINTDFDYDDNHVKALESIKICAQLLGFNVLHKYYN